MHLLCKVHCRMQCKTATFAMQRERKRVREREGGATLPISPLLARAGHRQSLPICPERIAARPARAARHRRRESAKWPYRLRTCTGGTANHSSSNDLRASPPRLRGELTLGDEAPSRCPFVSAPTWAARGHRASRGIPPTSSPRLRGPHPADLFLTVPSKIVSAPAWAAHGRATELRLAQVIAPAPTRAAREGRCECPTWTHRLRAYTGGTLLTSTPGREQRCSGTGWLRSAPTGRLAWSPAPTPRLPTPRSPLRWHAD